MSHNVESMAYSFKDRADVPWHGLGTPVTYSATPQQMLVEADLDWTVSKRRTYTTVNPPYDDGPSRGFLSIDDTFALVRDSDNKYLGPAGKDYVPTQNAQAFEFFKRFTEAGHMVMDTAGSLDGGRRIWALAKMKRSMVLLGDDKVEGYLLLCSPHIWGKSLITKFTTIRVVCANTMAIAMSESKYGSGFRAPHVRAFGPDVQKEATIALGITNELFDGFEATANKLARVKVDNEVVVRYVADVYQGALLEEAFGKNFYKLSEAKQAELILSPSSPKIDASQFRRSAGDALSSINRSPGSDLISASGTLWGAFNGITYHADHVAGRDRSNALQSAWFGPMSVMKSSALKRAIQIAEVAS